MHTFNQIGYTDTGKHDADALILLHSGGMNHTEWKPQLTIFEKHYRVICIDQPGHGTSIMRNTRLSIRECGESVLEIMAHLNITQAHFCGSSMGGATTLWLAVHFPHKINKMILYRVNYRKNQATFEQTQNMSNPEYWQKVGLEKQLSAMHMPQGGESAWKDVIQRVSHALDPANVSDRHHTLNDLQNIHMPTLIACGDRDPLVPLPDLFDMHQALPNSDLWVMPHASHVTATNTWRGGIFAEEVHRFLARARQLVI